MAPKRSAAALAPPAPPAFVVKLQKRDLEALRIPAAFFGHVLQKNVELEVLPSKRRYFVVVAAGGVFTSGWKAFCKNNGIKEGDSIVFKATKDGSNVLTCRVFGPDGCAKQDAREVAGSSKKRTRESGYEVISSDEDDEDLDHVLAEGIDAALARPEQERQILFTNCEVLLSIKKLGGQIRSETKDTLPQAAAGDDTEDRAAVASPTRTSRSAAKNKEAAVAGSKGKQLTGKKDTAVSPGIEKTPEPETTKADVPKKAAPKASTSTKKASSSAKRSSSARKVTKAASPRKAAASPRTSPKFSPTKPVSPPSKKKVTTPESVSPTRSRLQSKLDAAAAAAGSPFKTPTKSASGKKPKGKGSLLKVEKTVKTKRAGTKSPGKSSTKKPAAPQTPAEAKALARARSFTSANPHDVLVMKKSNLSPSYLLAVPRTFARESLPQEIEEFEMLNDQDNAWNVRWLPSPKLTFSGGWIYFAQDNKLDIGDACVIELLGKRRVKMHVFRASESDSADGDADKNATNDKQKEVETVLEAMTTTTTTTATVTVVAATTDYNPEEEDEARRGAGRRSTGLDVPPVSMVAPAS